MRQNIGLKIVSVALAIIVWFSVAMRTQSEVSVETQVGVKHLKEGLGISEPPPHVVVGIRGPERLIKNLDPSKVKVFIDMSRARTGSHTYNIDPRNISLPPFMKLISISPSSVAIKVEEIREKTLPIKAKIIGTPRRGRVRAVRVSPSEAVIKVVSAMAEKIEILMTSPIDISNSTGSIKVEASLSVEEGVRTDIEKVVVEVDIR